MEFFKILSETIKNFLKNVKLIASIAALSLLLSTALLLLFSFSVQSITTYMINSTTDSPIFSVLFVSVELTFLLSYVAIGRLTVIATVIATATSYTGAELSLPDLFSEVKSKWRGLFCKTYLRSGNPTRFQCIVAAAVAFTVAMYRPDPVTITIASVFVVSIFVYQLNASVSPAVAAVILVVEDGCEAAEVVERAEKLVEGQRLHGFMANLISYVVALIVCLGFWMIVGDNGGLHLTVYGLFAVDFAVAMRIFLSGVHTVYYFRCREYHGEKIQPLGNYIRLPYKMFDCL